eukprot:1366651-Pyramimonas_sp.AAC.1
MAQITNVSPGITALPTPPEAPKNRITRRAIIGHSPSRNWSLGSKEGMHPQAFRGGWVKKALPP